MTAAAPGQPQPRPHAVPEPQAEPRHRPQAEVQPQHRPQAEARPAADAQPHPEAPQATVSTHVLDTSAGRPAPGVPVALRVRAAATAPWTPHAAATTDTDGRAAGLPPLPPGTAHARLEFDVTAYAAQPGPFFPEVTVAFAVVPGEHFHVPLLLNPFGYSVYRGS